MSLLGELLCLFFPTYEEADVLRALSHYPDGISRLRFVLRWEEAMERERPLDLDVLRDWKDGVERGRSRRVKEVNKRLRTLNLLEDRGLISVVETAAPESPFVALTERGWDRIGR